MWELKVKVTMMTAEVKEWMDEEAEEMVRAEEWGEAEEVAELKIRIAHTAKDEDGEYLPDDEVTADEVSKAVEEWQRQTGLVDDETTIMGYNYSPEKAKKVK